MGEAMLKGKVGEVENLVSDFENIERLGEKQKLRH